MAGNTAGANDLSNHEKQVLTEEVKQNLVQ
jgi:hypothetical protein